MIRSHSARPLVGAGFVVWMAAGVPQAAAWASGRACFEQSSVVWCVAYGSFALALLPPARALRLRGGRAGGAPARVGQGVAALVALALGNTGLGGALLGVVAGESPLVVGEKTGFVWV